MANDKDFIVKNAVEVGGPTNVTLGTVTSISPFNFLNISYENKSLNVSSKESNLGGGDISVDGTKFYVVGGVSDSVHQYNLSTAFDLSTASFTASFAFSQDGFCKDVKFKSDGTKMYLLGADNNTIYQFSLSTAWAVSTASYDSVSFSHSSQSTVEQGLFFKPDGTKFYMVDNNGNIYQYSMSTSWNLSTASYDSVSYTSLGNAKGITFNSEGNTFLLAIGDSTDYIKEYTLSTAWNISTASPTGSTFDVGAQTNDPNNIVLSNNDTSLYIISSTSHQYSSSLDQEQINLDTGNYFKDTLAANTTYTLSNAGDVQSFQLEVTGGSTSYDLSSTSYDNKSYSVTTQETIPSGLAFKPDGTKMYVAGRSGDTIDQYSLSTAWDVSTASFDSVSFSVISQDANPWGLFFKPDGTKMFMQGYGSDGIYQYSLSTAWDLSTASYDSVSLSVNSQSTTPKGLAFKSDGTSLFIGDGAGNNVYQYTLTTAWDLSTASYASISYAVSGLATLQHITFNNDGTYLYILDTGSDEIVKEYSLSTAWNVSTASATGNTLTVTAQDPTMHGLVFKPDGTRLYITGNTGDNIYQYSGGDLGITWPSSIEWAGGVAPAAPAASETDVFTITTDDGGTSYIGTKTADNLS